MVWLLRKKQAQYTRFGSLTELFQSLEQFQNENMKKKNVEE